MSECKICWNTGYFKGIGGPCKEGCKPPDKKHGLSAVTAPDAAKPPWQCSPVKQSRPWPPNIVIDIAEMNAEGIKAFMGQPESKAVLDAMNDPDGCQIDRKEMDKAVRKYMGAGKAETEALQESRARYRTGGKVPTWTIHDADVYYDSDGTLRNADGTRSIFDDVDQ